MSFYKKILSSLKDDDCDFIYNALKIENFSIHSESRLRHLFNHIRQNVGKQPGDIFEFGVYRGNSLISLALLLKSLNSDKKVYGFDSFSGFPNYHENDDLKAFSNKQFSDQIRQRVAIETELKARFSDKKIDASDISSSGDFSDTSQDYLLSRIECLGLDNIVLINGDFAQSVSRFFAEHPVVEIFASNIDCDLYGGYKAVLPLVWDRLVKGGYVHLDEYYSLKFPGARIACNEFFAGIGINPLQKNRQNSGEFERWYFKK